jgi:hypothetical protein
VRVLEGSGGVLREAWGVGRAMLELGWGCVFGGGEANVCSNAARVPVR